MVCCSETSPVEKMGPWYYISENFFSSNPFVNQSQMDSNELLTNEGISHTISGGYLFVYGQSYKT